MKHAVAFCVVLVFGLSDTSAATISFSGLQNRNGIYYEIDSTAPFTGTVTEKFDNGQERYVANYKDGQIHGEFIEWYPNGKKKTSGHYKNNRLDGAIVKWLDN